MSVPENANGPVFFPFRNFCVPPPEWRSVPDHVRSPENVALPPDQLLKPVVMWSVAPSAMLRIVSAVAAVALAEATHAIGIVPLSMSIFASFESCHL